MDDEPATDWRDLGLDEAHIIAIGRIAVAFGNVEFLTTNLLWPMVGSDSGAGRLVAGGEPMSWQLERIQRLAPYRFQPVLAEEVINWVQEVRGASARRNRVLHDAWHVDRDDLLIRMGYRRGESEIHESSLEELEAFAEELADLVFTTFDLMKKTSFVLTPELLPEEADRAT